MVKYEVVAGDKTPCNLLRPVHCNILAEWQLPTPTGRRCSL